ncbi:helix-turn-helix transcriptional regulator [Flavobacterium cheonhonense]|uniref:Helix-turn-helix transcriptional regulator n=1 Tax=Flavobacterium cheonhonense TaxID=706185 RepID=A0ABP7TBE1_9FLAO|nr:helix-turn-helix domain-containing protein [Flavobacterium cheonhonense]
MNTTAKPTHLGRKISKIRELRGMKQEALAIAIGVSQQTVSTIENSEEVEEKVLTKIAEALGVSVEGIKNFSEEAVLNIIGNTYNIDNASSAFNFNCAFNPLEKLIESYEENKRLYERLLQAEKDKVAYLEQLKK